MRRFRLSLRLALTLSLALNLFLAATLAAPYLFPPPPRERGEARITERNQRRLPEADRPAFEAAHERHAATLRRSFEAMRTSRAKMREALGAEPFDAGKFSRAVEDWRSSSDATQQAFYAMMLDAAPKMSSAGRLALLPGPRRD
jgi:uncharacterized membrane protein